MKACLCQTAAYVIQSKLALQLRLARLPHRWNQPATAYPFEDLTQSFSPATATAPLHILQIHITLGA